jgi:cell division control protein 24
VKQWETAVKRLIEKVAMRRASERSSSRLAHLSTPNGYNPPNLRNGAHDRGFSSNPVPSISSHPYANSSRPYRQSSPYQSSTYDDQNGTSGHAGGPSGYPPHGGFEPDDDLEDQAAIVGPTSGRATPQDGRRGTMAPGFDQYYAYERPRALTEDANGPALSQWRSNVPGLPSGPSPRIPHAQMGSTMSYASEPSFGAGPRASIGRPQLRTQYSSSHLRPPHESGSDATSPLSTVPVASPLSRTRSASQPSVYVPMATPVPAPPLPSNGWDRTQGSTSTTTKRSSNSSQSTGDDSTTYSPNSSSPITPFGSSDSSLAGAVVPVKVKVYFGSDIFVIQVGRTIHYGELVERVGKKIRLCGPRRDNGPLRVKYEDEEGDLISMRSTEDVEMAFGDKTQVVLHVA